MSSRNNPKIVPRESHETFLGKKAKSSHVPLLYGIGIGTI
jgi:hypothetical protein